LDAFFLSPQDLPSRFFLTCEHASPRLPEKWTFSKNDQRLLGKHWQFDIGSRDLTLEIVKHIKGGKAILANTTRLLVDANRTLQSDTLFLKKADGIPVDLNQESVLTDEEKETRLKTYYYPFHNKIQETVQEFIDEANKKSDKLDRFPNKEAYMFSIHSFTPVFEQQPFRKVEVGVLYDTPIEATALRLYEKIKSTGQFNVELNQPYSSMINSYVENGYKMPSFPEGTENSPFTWLKLELESRQDLIAQPEWRKKIGQGCC